MKEEIKELDRRGFLKGAVAAGVLGITGAGLIGCQATEEPSQETPSNEVQQKTPQEEIPTLTQLPPSSPDPASEFGVDMNINMDTIDDYLGREDVAYRDVRMLFDPADYGSIGGNADLSSTLEGFTIVPYPYLATLPALPVDNAYAGESAYSLTWDESGDIESATEQYEESKLILDDLFPKDKAIFIMCGGGGYAGMTKALLVHLGWDAEKIYNVGGNWAYTGKNAKELIVYAEDATKNDIYATWRADYAFIDFSRLHAI